jgi:conjugal transfer pilus assembly protein TraF
MLAIFVSVLLLAAGPQASHAQSKPAPESQAGKAPAGQGRFLDDRERGWHWYEVEPEPEPEPLPEETPPAGPPPMSVPWLRAEFERATEAAVENPTRERVEYWAYLKKILLDKSEKFARMAMQVNELNPVLDETIQNPVQTAVRNAVSLDADERTKDVLAQLSQDVGIIYFYKSDCSFCAKQNLALDGLMRLYGFKVTAVSLDHRPFATGHFPDWVPDGGQAAKLGVTQTPTLYLFKPPGQVALLTVGAQSRSSLERRVLSSSLRAGWIDQATFERAVLGMERRYFLDKITEPGAIDWSDPSKALQALKALEESAVVEGELSVDEFYTEEATPWSGGVE